MRRRRFVLSGVLSLGLCGCPSVAPPPVDGGGPSGNGMRIDTVVADAAFPAALAIAADGRIFYTEKETGRVRILSGGVVLDEPFVSVPVAANSERGLLGIALHPDFASNGLVYVYYTRSSTGVSTRDPFSAQDNRVVRFAADGNVATGDEELILSLPASPGPNHNGGNIHFGPDGKLYISIGDLADSSNSQRIDTLPGKILRINDDGTVPDDNPFGAENPAWALGLRNSYDFTFDPLSSGVIFATENGTNRHDEVNRIVGGGNYGWPDIQGMSENGFDPEHGTYHEPIVDIIAGVVVPTGIAVVPDATFGAATEGQLLVSEYNTGRILRYALNNARDTVTGQSIFVQGVSGGMTDIAFAPDGTLYIATTTQILHVTPE